MAKRPPKPEGKSEPRHKRKPSKKADTNPSELPCYIDQQISLDIEERIKNIILELVLNWSSVDFYIENSVYNAYKDINDDHKHLIQDLSAHKQLEVLSKLKNENRLPRISELYLEELKYSFGNYKFPRNYIAHGIFSTSQDGTIFVKANGLRINTKDFDLYLMQSRYAVRAAMWLLQCIIGHPSPATLPKRPPLKVDQ